MTADSHDNEVFLRRTLRIYRNAVVEFIRLKLTASFGASASEQLASVFAKKDKETGKTQWDIMRTNAHLARAVPEISTTIEDDFELLGVAQFYSVFEKFFSNLFPESDPETAEFKEERSGLLRCIRQIKVLRDPSAHEVTEDLSSDTLVIAIGNAISVLSACHATESAAEIREILKEIVTQKPDFSVSFFCGSGDEICLGLSRELKARAVKTSTHDVSPKGNLAALPLAQNVLVFVDTRNLAEADLLAIASEVAKRRLNFIPLVPADREQDSRALLAAVAKSNPQPVVIHPEYLRSASERIQARLVQRPRKPPVLRPLQDATAASTHIVSDASFVKDLYKELYSAEIQRVCLVSPFVTDLPTGPGAGRRLSSLLSEKVSAGAHVSIITRPPSSHSGSGKVALLETLEREKVEVFVNEKLHAKIYLIVKAGLGFRWFVGSHNLTISGTGKWLEASATGFRELEYREAEAAMIKIREDRGTIPFHIWKAQKIRQGAVTHD